ncbi:MAG TPA: glycosyltransferase family 4 protein [Chlamydiales bacterium]|nr:glycosyltransferase family 4 protein [Chlamydiales bacterium]
MNILHLEASPGWGGQEIRILREAEGMRKRGHTVILGVMKGGGLIAKAREAGFTVYELNFKRPAWPLCLFQLLAILRRHGIELVNTHSSLDAWIGGIAARLAGCIVVRTRHLSTPIKPGLNSRLLYGKLADFVVTTCASILPMICTQSGKGQHECRSIATGVDPEKIRVKPGEAEDFRKAIGVGPGDFLIGTACFMRSWKGIDDFLKAAHSLRGERHLKWVIIGGGHAETYKKLAAEMQLENIVHFTGHLDNPFPALKALDLFALLSTAHEGVSQAILQAAYLGKPLLATATGGLGEVCLDQVTGIQVPPFSSELVAKAIWRLQGDPALCQQLGQNARKLVEENFTLAHTLDQMEAVYKSLRMS